MTDALARICGACGGKQLTYVGDLPLHIPGGQVPDSISKCTECGTYSRNVDFDDPVIRTHFDVTSYTVPEAENHVRLSRIGFLEYVMDLATRHTGTRSQALRVLDIGTAYGHLLELFREQGASCTGLEIVDWLRNRLLERGYAAFRAPQELPVDAQFDIITMIDSLYYVQRPGDLLREIQPRLRPDGILVMRIANRTPVFKLLRAFGRPITNDVFGDVKYNFTLKGIERLLADSGYRIELIILKEKGKKIATATRLLFYKLSLAASHLTGMKLTPGIILICRRAR